VSPSDQHAGIDLQDLLDGTLDAERRAALEAHLDVCPRCRREFAALDRARRAARMMASEEPVPPALEARVRAALDAEDAKVAASAQRPRERHVTRRRWIVGAVAAAAAVVLATMRALRPRRITNLVADDFAGYASGDEPLTFTSRDPAAVSDFFRRNGIGFNTRVFDLGMMRYDLAGGRLNTIDGRQSAFFAYRGTDGTSLVCQMYEGRLSELPATADQRMNAGIAFHVHRMDALTLVFWEEGPVVRVLASDVATERVVELAFAKALAPAGAG
jgi:anti-sigma factor RsiW